MSDKPRVLVVAEAANPRWVSVPLVGWSHAEALARVADVHLVTQIRNRDAIASAGWTHGKEFTALDTERSAAAIHQFDRWVRRLTGLGWTLSTALSAIPYYHFEVAVSRRFGASIEAGEYDVVHRLTPLSPTTPSLSLVSSCRRAGVPFVWGPVNGGVAWPREFASVQRAEGEWLAYVRDAHRWLPGYRRTRRDAAALIAGSRSVWEQFEGHHDRSVYIPENAIDPRRFGGTCAERDGPLRVVFVGRLVPYKGADMLLEAVAPLVREGRMEVDVLGDGPQMPELVDLRRRLNLESGVTLDGWVPHDELQDRMCRAQVLGFPSVREFGGGVVLEAMALGLVPVVVSYAGPAELVTDATGFRVPVGSRDQIVASLRRVFERLVAADAPLRDMGSRARRRVQRWFTWDRKAEQMLEVYRWVMGRRERPDFGMPFPDGPEPDASDRPPVVSMK